MKTELEVGVETYDKVGTALTEFSHQQIRTFFGSDVDPRGPKTIQACFDGASVVDYEKLSM